MYWTATFFCVIYFSSSIFLGGAVVMVPAPEDSPPSEWIMQQPFADPWLNLLKPLHHPSGSENETIYSILSNNKEYSKLTKAINFVDDIVSILNDSSSEITFFATPNSALRYPHRRHGRVDIISLTEKYDLPESIHLLDEWEITPSVDDKSHKKKKKILKKIIHAILSYHILPSKFDMITLANNNTFATKLALPDSLGSRPLRIKVTQGLIPRTGTINFYSKIIRPDLVARNGFIHDISHSLLPPPPIFQELFMVPSVFSTFTSAIQRTGLTDSLDLHYARANDSDKGSLRGTSAVTVFAPSNHAFEALPRKLRLFLFSPFGARVLKKLLQYHIIPNLVLHTDYLYNKSDTSHSLYSPDNFDISRVRLSGTDNHPFNFGSIEGDFTERDPSFYSEVNTGNNNFEDLALCFEIFKKFGDPSHNNPFDTKHYDEILAIDTETCQSLTDAQQDFISRLLRLPMLSKPISPHEYISSNGIPSICQRQDDKSNLVRPPYPNWDQPPVPPVTEQVYCKPISSFDLTLPTLLTNYSVHAHVKQFNMTIPLPVPHKPHRILTKFTANHHNVITADIVGLNGVVHVIGRLLDPRGHQYPSDNGKSEGGRSWEDWEDWLPKWAAENY